MILPGSLCQVLSRLFVFFMSCHRTVIRDTRWSLFFVLLARFAQLEAQFPAQGGKRAEEHQDQGWLEDSFFVSAMKSIKIKVGLKKDSVVNAVGATKSNTIKVGSTKGIVFGVPWTTQNGQTKTCRRTSLGKGHAWQGPFAHLPLDLLSLAVAWSPSAHSCVLRMWQWSALSHLSLFLSVGFRSRKPPHINAGPLQVHISTGCARHHCVVAQHQPLRGRDEQHQEQCWLEERFRRDRTRQPRRTSTPPATIRKSTRRCRMLALLSEVHAPNCWMTGCDESFIGRALVDRSILYVCVKEEEWKVVYQDVLTGKEIETTCMFILPGLSLEMEVGKRNVRSRFRQHPRIAESGASRPCPPGNWWFNHS